VPSDAAPTVTITEGAVRGAITGGGYRFLGLPFAAPPAGDLRWRPPRPPAAWQGVRDATTLGAGRDYDGTKLAALGIVVVTINHRLGALGFLAHPALASRPGGTSGNYGLMDQVAALRWVQDNIARFGGDPGNVTIAGQSSGGLSVLAHMISRGSDGLFHRAIVQSGSFALTQQTLAAAEADGQAFAAKAGCADQTADCLRALPVGGLVTSYPSAAIPGVVDGAVLEESVGTALASGRFARVPVYPLGAYPSPVVAFSALVSDANFACPALQIDRWTSAWVPIFAYEFSDDNAPLRYPPPLSGLPVATHKSEFPYLFDLPDAPLQEPLGPDQETLAASMRTAWANFAASGNPASANAAWPAFGGADGAQVRSLVPPRPRVESDFAARHHCAFWAGA
jgi:para-nitrobenzyl esterase